ncbi:MAG: hypothetical protein IRZ21_05390 [Thermoleophilaceae bacterium]|nr:hypothetical protein [Thermoleophilaceae bacterium]
MELSHELDPHELKALVKQLHQGDVLDVAKSVRLYSPDAPSYPNEVAGVPHDEPVMTMETRLPSGLSVIVSQDCDLRRMPHLEPYVVVAPLTEVDEITYREAADNMSTRFFAYPPIEGHEDKHNLVVDMRVVSSLEKTALLSSHIELIPCPLSGPRREDLLNFLGDRFGRKPFPDEIERQVIRPIESALKRVRQREGFAGVFSSVVFVGLRWSPGKSYCSLMLLLDPKLRERHKVADDDVEAVKARLQKALNHFTRNGDYSVIPNLHDVTKVQATVVLSHDEIPFEVEQLELD